MCHANLSPLSPACQARRKKHEDDELDALFSQYALALSFFERWCKRGVDSASAINATLNGYGEERTQVCICLLSDVQEGEIEVMCDHWRAHSHSASLVL